MRTSGILLTLALLGCTAKPGEPCEAEVRKFVAQLEDATPHMQARLVGIDADSDLHLQACEIPTLYMFDDYHGNRLTDEGQEVFARVCIGGSAVVGPWGFDYGMSLGDFYDSCGLARYGVVSRSEYLLQRRSEPFAWTLHQAMLDRGLSADQIRPITRAWLMWMRARAARFDPVADLRLPAFEDERQFDQFDALVVQISPSELVVGGRSVMQLEGGVLPDDYKMWFGELEEHFYKVESIYEARGERVEVALAVAADIDTPRATISEVIYMASRIGYTDFVLVGELEPFVFTAQRVFAPVRREY